MDHNDGHGVIEFGAALILVIGGAIFAALSLRTRSAFAGPAASRASRSSNGIVGSGVTRTTDAPTPSVGRSLVLMMAGLSLGGAVIHLAAAPSHFTEIGDLAAGFVIAAGFQALWAKWCLAGPSRRVMAVGIAGNAAILAAWAWTRTIGLPLGPLGTVPESIGYPDAAAAVFEMLLIGGIVVRWLGLDRALSRLGVARTIASIAVVPVIGLVVVLTSLATLAIATGLEHGAPAAHAAMEAVATH